jgi:outer membrane protein TolC
MLSLFIGRDLGGQTRFVKPVPITAPVEIRRPELLLFEAQSGIFDAQDKLLKVKALPKFNLFLQGGVGRPALNMLSNQFEPYYIGGLRFQWTPSVLYTAKRERAINGISRTKLEVQKETFLFNTDLLVKQQSSDIEKYRQLLASDDEIIQLQTRVKHAALAQLENGVINANDYLREVNMEDQARQSRILHETQLLMSQYNLQTTSGSQL